MVTYRELAKCQNKYVMHMSFYKLMELCYIKPKNADYVYSSSEHFLEGEDNKAERTVLENWMKHFKVTFHKDIHCSGHASKHDIEEMVREIKPNLLIPMHTVSAEEFKKIHANVLVPEKGKKMEI